MKATKMPEPPMRIQLLPSQASLSTRNLSCGRNDETERTQPIPYTGSPILLCLSDIALFVKNAWSIPGILFPFFLPTYTPLDELYPSTANIFCLVLHSFLIVLEIVSLLSLVFAIFFPLWVTVLYFSAIWLVIWTVSLVLNGTAEEFRSTVALTPEELAAHAHESWIFLNGVSVGQHWLLGNLNRLSLTFRRPILGIHNRTFGIVFDLLQCIIERDFCYATLDIRRSYAGVRRELLREDCKKVVLISHSQGALEASLLLDWMLAELPAVLLQKLEIYTFGCAANHFNNPSHNPSSDDQYNVKDKAVRRIEHYVHTGDFVARWGTLTFSRLPNRFMGRIFIRPATGHLLNQHYLNGMFPLDPRTQRVIEEGGFMNMQVDVDVGADGHSTDANGDAGEKHVIADLNRREPLEILENGGKATDEPAIVNGVARVPRGLKKKTVGDFSRLWAYRNGGSPKD